MKPCAYLCPLAEAGHVPGCGGKAAGLARLLALGLRVPAGVIVTDAALQAFLAHNDLQQAIRGIASLLDGGSSGEWDAAAAELRRRILAGEMPEPVREAMQSFGPQVFPGRTVIVRSSAVGEDGDTASFAGQLDSILDVAATGLQAALLACWASCWSKRGLAYQKARGVRLGGMGVIVQEQIEPVLAGVLFTNNVDLMAGEASDLLVEYHRGHGEALVQGRVDPGRAIIARDGYRVRHLALPEGERAAPDEGLFVELARAGLVVERACGRPQDIEWALDAQGRLWLVQARAITTIPHKPAARGTVRWSNANVNENYPEPISPLLYSIATTSYYHYFRNLGLAFGVAPARVAAMEQPLRHVVGVHGARIYYHLTNVHAVLRAAPFGEQLAAYFSAFTGAEPPETANPHGAGWRAWLEAAGIVYQGIRLFRRLPGRVAEFERTVDGFAERTTPERLASEDLPNLLEAFRGFLDVRFHRWLGASLADAAAMIGYGLLQHLLRREFPEADQSALHNTLLKGLADVISTQPLEALWRLSRIVRHDKEVAACFARLDNDALLNAVREGQVAAFGNALNEYLRGWGFRRSGELMLTWPGFHEEPGPLLDLVRAYAAVDGESPAERLTGQRRERTAETKRVLRILRGRRLVRWLPWPTVASLVGRLLPWCQSAIGLRERARTRQALLYSRCRAVVLAIGGKLSARGDFARTDDVFFLTWQEIDELLSGSAMFPHHVRDLVRLRRRAHAEVSEHKPPDVLCLSPGDYLPLHHQQTTDADGPLPDGFGKDLTGVGACGGQATGPAAVLRDVAECADLPPGAVLVTRQTDPGWGPAFLLIRGLVLERGGMLSHGAILAREYGIPSVVGVRDAVRLICPGQTVVVDGDRGVVRIIAR